MQMHITVQQVARLFNQEREVVAIIKSSFPGKCVRVKRISFKREKASQLWWGTYLDGEDLLHS